MEHAQEQANMQRHSAQLSYKVGVIGIVSPSTTSYQYSTATTSKNLLC